MDRSFNIYFQRTDKQWIGSVMIYDFLFYGLRSIVESFISEVTVALHGDKIKQEW